MPLHLEDHLDAATIEGSTIPTPTPATVEWRFDQAQLGWKALPLWNPPYRTPDLTNATGALRVTLSERLRIGTGPGLRGAIYVDVPDWDRRDWAEVVIRARADAASGVNTLRLGFNVREGRGTTMPLNPPFLFQGQDTPVVRDGTVQTYRLRVAVGAESFRGPWRQLVLLAGSQGEPGSIDILSVGVVPAAAMYAQDGFGQRSIAIGGAYRRSLFTHGPRRIAYRVRVPDSGRLDTALGVLGTRDPIQFRIIAQPRSGEPTTLMSERHTDPEQWAHRSVDLAGFAGQTLTLVLETSDTGPGAVAFWGAPTVSGVRRTTRPNVIFYVIDGGGADQMSLYGYNRRTTPNLDRLAAEGAVFEHAYSTSLWTGPSTATFMTGLHNSVLGNTFRGALPSVNARTLAERFHEAGYRTAVLTSNPNAGTLSNLQRGVDVFRDHRINPPFTSSVHLHREFWNWRAASSGEPYWVHFQSTDVHQPHEPQPPFAGLFASSGGRAQLTQWDGVMNQWRRRNAAESPPKRLPWSARFAETGIDRKAYYNLYRALYDESLAHQDYQLGRFVEQLRQSGEWEHTVLVIAADHAINRGSINFVVPMLDVPPPEWSTDEALQSPIFRSSNARVPLMFIWPGHIAGGQRLRQPVSMIDVMPTLLDLAGLPAPDVLQGQSLAPLLLDRPGWRARPVIFDEFRGDTKTGELYGMIEVMDGRWGASLWIGPFRDRSRPPLILYDVWEDPEALTLMNDARPDLVEKYTTFLQDQWMDHQALAKQFKPGGQSTLTPEQLERLRSLGYIR